MEAEFDFALVVNLFIGLVSEVAQQRCRDEGVFLSAIPKKDFWARLFRGRKEREILQWICNLGNFSQTRAICMIASKEKTCFLLFDKLCDYSVQNFVVGSSNSDDAHKQFKKESR